MSRRSITRVLLSLLLLVSQQMAMAHVITHWNGVLASQSEPSEAPDDDLSTAFARDQGCDRCLAVAQVACAIGNTPRTFAPPGAGSERVVAGVDRTLCARTVCVFRSRAPPAVA